MFSAVRVPVFSVTYHVTPYKTDQRKQSYQIAPSVFSNMLHKAAGLGYQKTKWQNKNMTGSQKTPKSRSKDDANYRIMRRFGKTRRS